MGSRLIVTVAENDSAENVVIEAAPWLSIGEPLRLVIPAKLPGRFSVSSAASVTDWLAAFAMFPLRVFGEQSGVFNGGLLISGYEVVTDEPGAVRVLDDYRCINESANPRSVTVERVEDE